MKVLITGCAGLIGGNFCKWLDPSIEIIGVDDLSGGYRENVPERVTFVHADLTNEADQSMIELYQSFEDSSIPNCPQCGQQMNKQFNSPPGIVFRGDGWAGKK